MFAKFFLSLTLAAGMLASSVTAQATSNLEMRLASVARLVSVSSAARKIESSSNEEARSMLEMARQQRDKAETYFKEGDEAKAAQELSQATMMLFKAAKLADSGESVAVKHEQDYDNRLESIEALLKQYRSVAEEKNLQKESKLVEADILTLLGEAAHLAEAKDYVKGRELLDKAYLEVKTQIIKLRNGEELVMSLDFASPQEEYDYYVGKIASQRKAINTFSKHITEAYKMKSVERILSQADQSQAEAEALVAKGDIAAALPFMESTLNKLRSGLMMVAN